MAAGLMHGPAAVGQSRPKEWMTMRLYALTFTADVETWPDMTVEYSAPSLEFAGNYAAKLLQSEANTMFVRVDVAEFNAVGQVTEIKVFELVTTRGVKELCDE